MAIPSLPMISKEAETVRAGCRASEAKINALGSGVVRKRSMLIYFGAATGTPKGAKLPRRCTSAEPPVHRPPTARALGEKGIAESRSAESDAQSCSSSAWLGQLCSAASQHWLLSHEHRASFAPLQTLRPCPDSLPAL
jgi:hypothetical protein